MSVTMLLKVTGAGCILTVTGSVETAAVETVAAGPEYAAAAALGVGASANEGVSESMAELSTAASLPTAWVAAGLLAATDTDWVVGPLPAADDSLPEAVGGGTGVSVAAEELAAADVCVSAGVSPGPSADCATSGGVDPVLPMPVSCFGASTFVDDVDELRESSSAEVDRVPVDAVGADRLPSFEDAVLFGLMRAGSLPILTCPAVGADLPVPGFPAVDDAAASDDPDEVEGAPAFDGPAALLLDEVLLDPRSVSAWAIPAPLLNPIATVNVTAPAPNHLYGSGRAAVARCVERPAFVLLACLLVRCRPATNFPLLSNCHRAAVTCWRAGTSYSRGHNDS
jgi:hypothetical protein